MAADEQAPVGTEKLQKIMGALRTSATKTKRYFAGTTFFYLTLITVFSILVATVEESKDRGADIGILILVSLGFLGMWISALRGLRGTKVTIGRFFNLYRFPLVEELKELEDEGRWSDMEEKYKKALELLERQAEAEKEHRAWPNRALSLSVITIIDILIWLVWDNWLMALINQGIAMVVSMVHINLGPTSSMKALAELKGGE